MRRPGAPPHIKAGAANRSLIFFALAKTSKMNSSFQPSQHVEKTLVFNSCMARSKHRTLRGGSPPWGNLSLFSPVHETWWQQTGSPGVTKPRSQEMTRPSLRPPEGLPGRELAGEVILPQIPNAGSIFSLGHASSLPSTSSSAELWCVEGTVQIRCLAAVTCRQGEEGSLNTPCRV